MDSMLQSIDPGRFLLLSDEDLRRFPVTVFRRVMQFIGLDTSDELAEKVRTCNLGETVRGSFPSNLFQLFLDL